MPFLLVPSHNLDYFRLSGISISFDSKPGTPARCAILTITTGIKTKRLKKAKRVLKSEARGHETVVTITTMDDTEVNPAL